MAQFDLMAFWVPCVVIGVGISIDVSIATLTQFRNQSLSEKTWSLPITATHILLLAVGYFGVWAIQKSYPEARFVLGLAGFILVALLVYEVFCTAADIKPKFALSHWFGERIGLKPDDARTIIAILAVSWDALLSGPAISAQTSSWSTSEVWASFLLAGFIVFCFAQLSLFGALKLRAMKFHDATTMGRCIFWGKYAELSVIGGFGVLSLWSGITQAGNIYASILISALVLSVFFLQYRKEISQMEKAQAQAAIYDE
jgi:hypothetical protein